MANKHAQPEPDVLCSTEATPIAQLHPDIPDAKSRVVDGVITITWPYSIVTRSIAFILAEHDAQLRRDKGQLRVEFHGAAGRALADSGVGSGDGIRLSLDGAQWEENQAQTNFRGTTLGWQMKFTNRLLLSIRKVESEELDTIDIDSAAEEPRDSPEPVREMSVTPPVELAEEPSHLTPLPRTPFPALPSKRLASSMLETGEYASPAFLKRARVSYGSLFEDGFDIFNEDEGRERKKPKKPRFSMNGTPWKYSSRSPSPEVEQQQPDEDEEPGDEPAETVVNGEATEQFLMTPQRPMMVDGACQTQELDLSPSLGVQVAAESRQAGMLLQSSPTPGWKHGVLNGELQQLPNLVFDHVTYHGESPRQELEAIHRDETGVPSTQLGFDFAMNIDPSLQLQTVHAVNQHTEYAIVPSEDEPRQGDFHETRSPEALPWAPETQTTYPPIPASDFAEHQVLAIGSSSPARQRGAESEDEEYRQDATGRDRYERAYASVQDGRMEEMESVSSDESESEQGAYPPGQRGEYQRDGEGVSMDKRMPNYWPEKPAADESEVEDAEDEDDHWDFKTREYDGSEEEFDDEEDYHHYETRPYGDENEDEDEDEEDESEEYGEDEMPPPRPVPPPSKEPIFISLLSDSEDDDRDANVGKQTQSEIKAAIIHHENEEESPSDESESEGEDEDDNEKEEEEEQRVEAKAESSPSPEYSRAPSQLDGCDDEVPIERATGEDIEGGTEETTQHVQISFESNDEAHQIPKQVAQGTGDTASSQDESARLKSPDPQNNDEPVVPDYYEKTATQQREDNVTSFEAVAPVNQTTTESLLPSEDNVRQEMDGVETQASKGYTDGDSEVTFASQIAYPDLGVSQGTTQITMEVMEEDTTVQQDVEMEDAVLEQPGELHMSQKENGVLSEQDGAGTVIMSKDTEVFVSPAPPPPPPPGTQSEHAQEVPSTAETAMTLASQETPRQPPSSGEPQHDESTDLAREEPQLRQEVEDDLAAEQQLMSEFLNYSSSPVKAKESHRPASAISSPVQLLSFDGAQEQPRQKGDRQEPEMLITVHSLRSHCRSHRRSRSIDSANDMSADLSISLARATPTTKHCLIKDISPPTKIRVTRGKMDQPEPSIALAKAAVAASSKSDKSRENNSPATIRLTNNKAASFDHSILLARSSPSPSRANFHGANSPKSTRQPIASELARNAPQVSQRGETPESATVGDAFPSPSVASSVAEDSSASALKLQLLKTLRTSLPDCLPLRSLRTSLNKTTDILAVATVSPRQPYRPKHGPRDYMLELVLTDPSVAPASVNVAHVFRPHQASLPVVHAGDVVLLRRVQVVSMHGRGFGVRVGDLSAWAVFEKGDEEMLPQIKGPPVELLGEEVEYAQGLRRWWNVLDEKMMAKIGKASQKVSQQAHKDDSRG